MPMRGGTSLNDVRNCSWPFPHKIIPLFVFPLFVTLIEFHCFERVLALTCPLFKLLKRFRNFPDADFQH